MLKRNKGLPKHKHRSPVPPAPPPGEGPATPTAPGAGRKWAFRSAAVILPPVLLLALAEFALRLIGYGYPSSFFLSRDIHGQKFFVENSSFGRSFFPPALARSPSPVVMRAQKPRGTYRIFLFGESAAMGDPRPAYGAGRYLEALLRERFPGSEFEVVCTAMTAVNSHAIVPIARECARYDGDLWIIYMGNNEMVGPFGASTIFGAQALPWTWVRAYLALERTRTGQWLVAATRRFTGHGAEAREWTGLKMFRNRQLAPNDPRKERVYANFRRNLEDILTAGRHAGVPVIVSSVGCNLRDCAPFGSAAGDVSTLASGPGLDKICASAQASGHWVEAQRDLAQAAAANPQSADLQFHLGQCFLHMTNLPAAQKCFARARDLDTLAFRADSHLNQLDAQIAQSHSGRGVFYVDAAGALSKASPFSIPGRELFLEHVHLTPAGNYVLGRAWAEEVAKHLPVALAQHQSEAWATPELCAQRLGLTDWNRVTILEEIAQRFTQPPYTDQSGHADQARRLAEQIRNLRASLARADVAAARILYHTALERRPDDHWLHHNYAEFLTATGELDEAVAQMQIVCDLIPHHYAAYYHLGRLLARQRRFSEARASLETALRLQPGSSDVSLQLGEVSMAEGQFAQALNELAAAERARPDDIRVWMLRAGALEQLHRRPEAVQCLRQAVRLQPLSWEAQHVLGVELALSGSLPEAQTAFEQAVNLRPEEPNGHVDLAMALARQGKLDPARTQLDTALRLDPGNRQAAELRRTLEQVQPAPATP